tara:strand:- start:934 stop:1164 length:231 start_codon:yes stop_codon:yes gene_type:complete
MTEKEKVRFDLKREKEIAKFKKESVDENWKQLQMNYEEKKQIDNYYNDVRIIRKNVQYFFWVSIISIISTIIFLLF